MRTPSKAAVTGSKESGGVYVAERESAMLLRRLIWISMQCIALLLLLTIMMRFMLIRMLTLRCRCVAVDAAAVVAAAAVGADATVA